MVRRRKAALGVSRRARRAPTLAGHAFAHRADHAAYGGAGVAPRRRVDRRARHAAPRNLGSDRHHAHRRLAAAALVRAGDSSRGAVRIRVHSRRRGVVSDRALARRAAAHVVPARRRVRRRAEAARARLVGRLRLRGRRLRGSALALEMARPRRGRCRAAAHRHVGKFAAGELAAAQLRAATRPDRRRKVAGGTRGTSSGDRGNARATRDLCVASGPLQKTRDDRSPRRGDQRKVGGAHEGQTAFHQSLRRLREGGDPGAPAGSRAAQHHQMCPRFRPRRRAFAAGSVRLLERAARR